MDSRATLRTAIESAHIPGSPPAGSREEAAIGLGFLDIALRQNHVRRITERLHIVEHGAAACTTEVDINLGALDQEQRKACQLFRSTTRRSESANADTPSSPLGPHQPGQLWVPVARLAKSVNTPIDVRDSSGSKVSRLTQLEVAIPVAAGAYELLRGTLSSLPDARSNGNLGKLLYRVDESRWLIQTAIMSLFVSRANPEPYPDRPAAPSTRPGASSAHRAFALSVLQTHDDDLAAFYDLLDVALSDYMVVVALPENSDDHLLTYDVPLKIESSRLRSYRHVPLTHASGAYRVDYETHVPSSLRAYHLVAETDPDLNIDGMFLTSDVNEIEAQTMTDDLNYLATEVRKSEARATGRLPEKVLEHELRVVIGRMAELLRRRLWQAGSDFGESLLATLPNATKVVQAVLSGEVALAAENQRASLLHHPDITAKVLESSADELSSAELGSDLFEENDPASSRAHVYWRRYSHSRSSRRIIIRSSLVITDATAVRPFSVMRYCLAVLALSWVVPALISHSWTPLGLEFARPVGAEDAVVAVLLLIPGFLFARLDLPQRNSVAARIGSIPRLAAYGTMGVAIAEAVVVATQAPVAVGRWVFYIGSIVLILSGAILAFIGIGLPRYSRSPQIGPKWADRSRSRQSIPASMRLFASGVQHD